MDKETAAVSLAYAATGGVVASFVLSLVSEELALVFFVLAILVGGAGIAVALSIARDNSRIGEAYSDPVPPMPYPSQPVAYAPPPPPGRDSAPRTDSVPEQSTTDDGWGL